MPEKKFYDEARRLLREKYGETYQAFPSDELEVLAYSLWLNNKLWRLN